MKIEGAVVVITGAGSGIGAALARRCHVGDAEQVIVCDIDGDAAKRVAGVFGGVPEALDVSDANAVKDLIERTVARYGRIDLFCSNAGIVSEGGLETSDATWTRLFDVNVMAHVFAARAVVPHMLEHGRGHILITASAAGLLSAPGDAAYTVTKHAAVGFAEWLSITHGDDGIGVSVLCPMGVATPMFRKSRAHGHLSTGVVAASGTVVTPEYVTDVVIDALRDERFLILPQPEVATFWSRKTSDPERWLAGMRRLVSRL
jgi:NAD(P)-dependent dehydrogenase (short-subunit alcohol dehydrogenase family)